MNNHQSSFKIRSKWIDRILYPLSSCPMGTICKLLTRISWIDVVSCLTTWHVQTWKRQILWLHSMNAHCPILHCQMYNSNHNCARILSSLWHGIKTANTFGPTSGILYDHLIIFLTLTLVVGFSRHYLLQNVYPTCHMTPVKHSIGSDDGYVSRAQLSSLCLAAKHSFERWSWS